MYAYYTRLKEPEITPLKAGLLFLLCAVWVFTGLIGHDPWKPDEAYGFGLIYHILQHGEWLVPTLAGEPYLDKPPLYYWVAALTAQLFSPLLPLHDGARLASGLFTALMLLFAGLTGRELFGNNRGWPTAIILIGCLGLLVRAHEILTDNALLAGCAMLLYGYALSLRHAHWGGVWLGTGLGMGFMSKGFIAPVLFLLITLGLLTFRHWRTRDFALTLGIALLAALPWLTLWPWLLYQHAPDQFMEWAWQRNMARWLDYVQHGDHARALYYLTALPWLAWPAAPLAAWTLWEARRRLLQQPEFQLLLVSLVMMLIALSSVRDINDQNALPMLLPLALLATASLSTLRRGAANALDWFGIMTFALLALILWSSWTGLLLNYGSWLAKKLQAMQPGFQMEVDTVTFTFAVIASIVWIVLVWRVGRSVRRALINWAAGISLLWILVMTLWLPWLDAGKSYRPMAEDLRRHLPADHACIAGLNVGDSQRAMLQYFGGIELRPNALKKCPLLLVQGEKVTRPIEHEIGWEKVWEGSRQWDERERFRLYRRIGK
ncbi:MAG: hypothetical protein Fur0040_04950 [Sideroxydans sp.]